MTTPRTICIMGRVLDQMDGLGVYSATLLRYMFKQDTASRYVILLRSDENAALFDEFPNVETCVRPARSKTWWDQVVAPLAARQAGADIIFNPKFSVPLLSGRPAIFVLHGSDWYVNPGNYLWWDNIYIRTLLPIYCHKATRLLSISQTVVDDLVRYARLDATKVTVSYAAAAPHFAPITEDAVLREFAERYKLPDRFILTVGRVYHTGHDRLDSYPGGNNETLIRAYRRYRAAGGRLPLVVAGRDIDQYLKAQGFSDADLQDVHFTGFIPNSEIVKAYNLAEFFVLATLYESFCLPLIEAMASGCPALVPDTGGCPELGSSAARYVNPRDAEAIGEGMLELAASPELRAEMRRAGVARARMFSWERTAHATIAAFDQAYPLALHRDHQEVSWTRQTGRNY
ncbi:MAG: glycosyltransferase family 4 protein [Candidatus Binatia bacterium]